MGTDWHCLCIWNRDLFYSDIIFIPCLFIYGYLAMKNYINKEILLKTFYILVCACLPVAWAVAFYISFHEFKRGNNSRAIYYIFMAIWAWLIYSK